MAQDLAKRSLTYPELAVTGEPDETGSQPHAGTYNDKYLAIVTPLFMAAYRMKSVCMSIVGYLQPGTCINTVCDCQFVASFGTK